MEERRYVIIGNSAAAAGAVEGIRSADRTGSITVVSDEPYHIYSRPLISYLLEGKTDEERMLYRPRDFYERTGVDCLLGRRAEKVDPERQEITLDDGTVLPYSELLIAAGSRPFVPPVAGLDAVERCHTFMTLDAAKALAEDVQADSRVLIVGAGLIGLKCAEALRRRAGSISVCDIAPHVLPSILDEEGAARVEEVLKKEGIALHLGSGVSEFDSGEAVLSDGTRVPFDVLVIAVGVRPNTELYPEPAPRGIPTDAFCRTGVPHIYAAGDCAISHDITTGADRILALLPNAYMQGHAAGVNMAGGSESYDKAMPANALSLFGLHMITAGSLDGEARVSSEGSYKKLVTRDGRLVGFLILGDVSRAGIYTALIREQRPLAEIDFELIAERPQLMAFSRRERRQKLRGGEEAQR